MRAKEFDNLESICTEVQNLMAVTKYNLKRSQIKDKKKATFVCSCISKKKIIKAVYSEKDPDPSEDTNENEGTVNSFNSLNGFKRKGRQSRKAKRTNIEACSFRLKFEWCEELKTFKFRDDSNLKHNHQPENNSKNVSFYLNK